MATLFYLVGILAIIATLLAITQRHAVHALLYLIVSLLSVAVEFFVLGAPFASALEIMIYAGAIMVLFVFVVMMLNLAEHAMEVERGWLKPRNWIGPALLALTLFGVLAYCTATTRSAVSFIGSVGPKQVGVALFGNYWIGVELASLLLMAGLVGAFHLGRQAIAKEEKQHVTSTDAARADTRSDLVHAGPGGTSHAAQHDFHSHVH
jgi:NADH-quinone oxidoreductase subunit J